MAHKASRNKGEPGRNEMCWCGSDQKYKKCHLNRSSERSLPGEALRNLAASAWKHKSCLHPNAAPGVCTQIVAAHSLQRSRTLEKIIDDSNHVLSFYPLAPDADGNPKLHRVGWRDASTFTGFCGYHDNVTFAPLETSDFTANAEQCFLLAYRAVCHELFQKTGALSADKAVRHFADRGRSLHGQQTIQRIYDIFETGTTAGLGDYLRRKKIMDGELLGREYGAWSRVVINFSGDLCIASTSATTPNSSLDGQSLQVLHDLKTLLQMLPLGIVSTPDGGAFVSTWRREESAPREFVRSLLRRAYEAIPGLIVQLRFAHIENTYFSQRWWDSLSAAEKDHIRALADVASPYYERFPLLPIKLVPWQITGISRHD
jgi:hypothetical protein